MDRHFLVVGLGNPGSEYEKTRHNLGFIVVEAMLRRQGLKLKKNRRLLGRMAQNVVNEQTVTYLLPDTFMNLSGTSVRKAAQFYRIAPHQLVIIVDDVYLKFGAMRFRPNGSPGGHNGLKSIEASLETQEYCRLRIGVGPEIGESKRLDSSLEEYVLANFSSSEQLKLPIIVENGIAVIDRWISDGVEIASQIAGELSKSHFVSDQK